MSAAAAPARQDRALWVQCACTALVALGAAYASYRHGRKFTLRFGADEATAAIWPLIVDRPGDHGDGRAVEVRPRPPGGWPVGGVVGVRVRHRAVFYGRPLLRRWRQQGSTLDSSRAERRLPELAGAAGLAR